MQEDTPQTLWRKSKMNYQIRDMITKQTFEEAIKWTEDRAKHGESPVFRITNFQSDILSLIRLGAKVEKYHKMFPESYLLKDLNEVIDN